MYIIYIYFIYINQIQISNIKYILLLKIKIIISIQFIFLNK